MMTFEEAQAAYCKAVEAKSQGIGQVMLPSKSDSTQDKNGRWALRNVRGFLAYVTTTGKVIDQKFQQIGE